MGKKSGSGSGIRDEQPGSYFLSLKTIFWVEIIIFFDADPRFGIEKSRIRDPGWKKVGSGIGKNIPAATLVYFFRHTFQLRPSPLPNYTAATCVSSS
jgi:hypothetical protein